MLQFQNTVSNTKTVTFADQQVTECIPSFPPEPANAFGAMTGWNTADYSSLSLCNCQGCQTAETNC